MITMNTINEVNNFIENYGYGFSAHILDTAPDEMENIFVKGFDIIDNKPVVYIQASHIDGITFSFYVFINNDNTLEEIGQNIKTI